MTPAAVPDSASARVDRRPRRSRRVVERCCVVCRRIADRDQLWRISRRANGVIAFDPEARLEGRGAYFCRTAECIAAVVADPRRLARSLRSSPPRDVLDQVIRHTSSGTAHSILSDCKESL